MWRLGKPDDVRGYVGSKVFGKSLHVLKPYNLPPFFQLYFLLRLKIRRSAVNRSKCEIAFCGNGFIHLNIAEIHEGDIGGLKTCAYLAIRLK